MARNVRTYPVAVVVFVNAEGADAHDAINVAERMIAQHLHDAADGGTHLVANTSAGLRMVGLGQTVELGRAVRAGLISLTTSPDAHTH